MLGRARDFTHDLTGIPQRRIDPGLVSSAKAEERHTVSSAGEGHDRLRDRAAAAMRRVEPRRKRREHQKTPRGRNETSHMPAVREGPGAR